MGMLRSSFHVTMVIVVEHGRISKTRVGSCGVVVASECDEGNRGGRFPMRCLWGRTNLSVYDLTNRSCWITLGCNC